MISEAQAIEQLIAASERLASDCERITDDRWAEQPVPGAWSPAEVVEHVALASANIAAVFDGIAERPLGSKSRAFLDEEIPFVFYGGDEPPNVATPTGSRMDRADAGERVRSATLDLCRAATNAAVDLRTVAGSHPRFGRMDGVQWLIFGFAHIERHRVDVRSAPITAPE